MIYVPAIVVLISLYINGAQCAIKANTQECIRAAGRIAKKGDGTTPNSCMSCDPTYGSCPDGCQNKINTLYYACDDICLPDGYFFDPPKELSGCWKDNLFDMKIAVERCGCDSGSHFTGSIALFIGVIACIFVFL